MKSASEINAEAAAWLARRDGEAWSGELQGELERWLDESTAHRVAYLRLKSVWQRADRLGSLHTAGRPSVARKPSMLERFPVWRIAAGFLIVVALGAVLRMSGVFGDSNTYVTAVGENRSFSLADGSRVTLNTDSRVRVDFSAQRRTIWLDRGEAFFDVVHNANRPFVVNAGDSRVADIGTKFSVRRDDGRVNVVVLDGVVKVGGVQANDRAVPVLASRNDIVSADGDRIVVSRQSPEQVADLLGWRDGKLILDQMTLAQAANEFNRYNRKQLIIDSPAAARIRIGGRFNVDNVEGFARLLQQGFGLKVVEDGKQIRITG